MTAPHVVRIERERGMAKRVYLDGVPVRGVMSYTLTEGAKQLSRLGLGLIVKRVEMVDVTEGSDPQPADASPLLDLVRQYGDMHAACVGLTAAGADEPARQHHAEAEALFDRIAALVPQQPVQARGRRGSLWWIHPCGTAMSSPDTPGSAHNRIPPCDKPGPWRPLLVEHPEGVTVELAPQRDSPEVERLKGLRK